MKARGVKEGWSTLDLEVVNTNRYYTVFVNRLHVSKYSVQLNRKTMGRNRELENEMQKAQ